MMSLDGTCLIVFLSFFVFVWVMKPLFFDPMLALKQQRETHIQSGEVAAAQAAEKTKQLQNDYEARMAQARLKAQQLLGEKREQARQQAADRLARSRQAVLEQHQSLAAQLESSQASAYQQLSSQQDDLVKVISQKVMVSFERSKAGLSS